MTVSYFRDLGEKDTLIICSSQGCYAIDLASISAAGIQKIHGIPPSAHRVNASDVGRILVIACNHSIKVCEERMEAAE